MKKYPLIGASIIVVVLIVLGSFNNIVGYQTVQASNQKIINTEINPRQLLFQTILDIANNKEIQKVILGSEITGKRFFDPGMRFPIFNHPVLTERILKRMYTMGVILSKTISKSKMHSMIEQFQVNNQCVQKEINAVIAKDAVLNEEITQLSDLKCDCGNDSTVGWNYPGLCLLLYPIWYFSFIGMMLHSNFCNTLFWKLMDIGYQLNCFWS